MTAPMHMPGQTRGSRRHDHLLQTPDTFVRTSLPGLEGGSAIVHVGTAAGAGFTQYTLELRAGGTLASTESQRFLYVLEGAIQVSDLEHTYTINAGCFLYLPPHSSHTFQALTTARVAVIEKHYLSLAGISPPTLLFGQENDVTSGPLLDDPALQVRTLLPTDTAFDFAVNTMTYEPGAALPQVEMHVMEHGLLMLEGGGIYRLGDHWYPVAAGDFIWMAPFCPQWFGALGKVPAKYLIYKDANRPPLTARVS